MTNNSTNCSKCGNPLTPGISSCPVCGTPVNSVAPIATPNVVVAPVEPVVAAAPVASATPVAPVSGNAAVTPSAPQPAVQQSVPTNNGGIVSMAPNITPVVPQGIPPVQQAPNPPEPVVTTPAQPVKEPKVKKSVKIKLNNKMLIIILVIIIAFVAGSMFLRKKSGTTPSGGKQPQNAPVVLQIDAVANGFKFKIDDGWIVQSNNDITIIKNAKDNAVIRLEKYPISISTLTKDTLQTNFNNLGSEYNPSPITIKDMEINDNKIGGKDAFLINCKVVESDNKEYFAQYYFINGGSELTIGASIVYYNEEAKNNYEGVVTALMGTLSYANDSDSIRDTISNTYNSFSVYYNAINGVTLNIPEIVEEPINNTDSTSPDNTGGEVTNPENTGETPVAQVPSEEVPMA